MSTRARIGHILPDGSVRSIYTHWGSSPDRHGPILLAHYGSLPVVLELLELGNLSILGPEIGEPHVFELHRSNQRFSTWCLAYGRDRGDRDQSVLVDDSIESFIDTCQTCHAEYAYLWREHHWITCAVPASKTAPPNWVPLTDAIKPSEKTSLRERGGDL